MTQLPESTTQKYSFVTPPSLPVESSERVRSTRLKGFDLYDLDVVRPEGRDLSPGNLKSSGRLSRKSKPFEVAFRRTRWNDKRSPRKSRGLVAQSIEASLVAGRGVDLEIAGLREDRYHH